MQRMSGRCPFPAGLPQCPEWPGPGCRVILQTNLQGRFGYLLNQHPLPAGYIDGMGILVLLAKVALYEELTGNNTDSNGRQGK